MSETDEENIQRRLDLLQRHLELLVLEEPDTDQYPELHTRWQHIVALTENRIDELKKMLRDDT